MKKISPLIFLLLFAFCAWASPRLSTAEDIASKHLQSPPSPAERQQAYLELFNRNDPRLLPTLMQALKDPDPYVRYTGAWMLNPIHMDVPDNFRAPGKAHLSRTFSLTPEISTEIVTALLDVQPEKDFWAQQEMLRTLLRLLDYQERHDVPLDARAKRLFLEQMEDPNPYIRIAAAIGLNV